MEPLGPIVFVDTQGVRDIPKDKVETSLVGLKAFGLSCLPSVWTLPFIVISGALLDSYRTTESGSRDGLIDAWLGNIEAALQKKGLSASDSFLIVRSSGCREGMEQRGKFYSSFGKKTELMKVVRDCLEVLSQDTDAKQETIPLVVQRYVTPISVRGHLSNERRVYREARDWLGEFEEVRTKNNRSITVNLRNWREETPVEEMLSKPLECSSSALVAEILRIPATWALQKKIRVHFEWIWDGTKVFVVQADQETEVSGENPLALKLQPTIAADFSPQCLEPVDRNKTTQFHKIRNVFIYQQLGLNVPRLYVLEKQEVIERLSQGEVPRELKSDLAVLVKGSLVIRTDVVTGDLTARQFLPRTDEIRDVSRAIDWLCQKSKELREKYKSEKIGFIFHNFIPARASAFSFAEPGQRKVQIEALWGLPEGLYFNSHDKYVVDTRSPRLENIDLEKFEIQKRTNFKRFFVTPDDAGKWMVRKLVRPFDWRSTIKDAAWIKKIALESRKIAEQVKHPTSIMWFVDVQGSQEKVIPWYHEECDLAQVRKPSVRHFKTPYDKTHVIQTGADIHYLEQEALKAKSDVRLVRIQLQEESLLREKDILKKIGELCQKIGATILLEGGVLSHAYYQLVQTNAVVEVDHPFLNFEGKREFNKLVRDLVPSNIQAGGEEVRLGKLSGELFLRALKEKLVEEAFEVLDTVDKESIIEELADVSEVIDGLLHNLGVDKERLLQRQAKKRNKVGGFKEGSVLIETRNPPPTARTAPSKNEMLLPGDDQPLGMSGVGIVGAALTPEVEKWTDRRSHPSGNEVMLKLLVPVVMDTWAADSLPISVTIRGTTVDVRARISGRRKGEIVQLELSLFTPLEQLSLFDSPQGGSKDFGGGKT